MITATTPQSTTALCKSTTPAPLLCSVAAPVSWLKRSFELELADDLSLELAVPVGMEKLSELDELDFAPATTLAADLIEVTAVGWLVTRVGWPVMTPSLFVMVR